MRVSQTRGRLNAPLVGRMEMTQEHILIGIVAFAALGALILLVWSDPDEKQTRDGG